MLNIDLMPWISFLILDLTAIYGHSTPKNTLFIYYNMMITMKINKENQ